MVICHFCKKKIISGQRRVHYTEDVNGKIDFDISFHAKCWKQKWDLSVDTQCKILAKNMMANVLPKVKHMIESREIL